MANERLNEFTFAYDQLRKEILQNHVIALQILGATVVFVGSIMGLALTKEGNDRGIKGILFFLAQFIVIASALQAIDRARGSSIIASYLRIFIEPRLVGMKWEEHLSKLRHQFESYGHGRLIFNQSLLYIFVGVLNFFLATTNIVSYFYDTIVFAGVVYFICLAGIGSTMMFIGIFKSFRRDITNHEVTFSELWNDILNGTGTGDRDPDTKLAEKFTD